MNPNKYAFGVSAGQFLDFMVHGRRSEAGQRTIKATNETIPQTNKAKLQSQIGKNNFI